MEGVPNFENREAVIDGLIADLARREEMNPEDIFSDITTFAGICREDEDARSYLEELAERIGISAEEMSEYANKKSGL